MTSVTNIAAIASTAPAYTGVASPSSHSANNNVIASQASSVAAPVASNKSTSSHTFEDPATHVLITQDIGAGGNITAQSPSAAAVAYLRQVLANEVATGTSSAQA